MVSVNEAAKEAARRQGEILTRLRADLKSNRLVIITGAGVTLSVTADAAGKPLSRVTWTGLIRNGLDYLVSEGYVNKSNRRTTRAYDALKDPEVEGLLDAANIVSSQMKQHGQFPTWLESVFGSLSQEIRYPALLDILKALHESGALLLTTNYDDILEKRCGLQRVGRSDQDDVSRFRRGDLNGVFHIHGSYHDPHEVVLDTTDYYEVKNSDGVQDLLKTFLQDKTILFIGCGSGLEDPNFDSLLRWASERHKNLPHRHCLLIRNDDSVNYQPLLRVRYGPRYEDLVVYLRRLLGDQIETQGPTAPVGSDLTRDAHLSRTREDYQTRTREDYQIGVICALAVEMAAMVAMLDELHPKLKKENGDENEYTLGKIGVHNVVIACLPAGLIGNGPAAIVANNMQRSFPINFGLMVGVGGGVWSRKCDIRLGDVVVSQPTGTHGGVIQWDFGRMEKGGNFQRTGSLDKPPKVLLHALQALKTFELTDGVNLEESLSLMVQNKPRMGRTYRYQGEDRDQLFEATYDHEGDETCDNCNPKSLVRRPGREDSSPKIHYGNIASGNEVMKHGTTRDKIAKEEGVICFEMEAAGLMDNFRCLVIRGICDYADSHKNKIWQPYAAATAAAFARVLLGFIDKLEVIQTPPNSAQIGQSIIDNYNSKEYSTPLAPQLSIRSKDGDLKARTKSEDNERYSVYSDDLVNIARDRESQGDSQVALALYNVVFSSRKKDLGAWNQKTLEAAYDIARTLEKLGRDKMALEWYDEIFQVRKNTLGKSHSTTLEATYSVARILQKQGRHEPALKWYSDVFDIRKESLGNENPGTLEAAYSVAEILELQGRNKDALTWYMQILETRKKAPKRDQSETLKTEKSIARVLEKMGRYNKPSKMTLQGWRGRIKRQ